MKSAKRSRFPFSVVLIIIGAVLLFGGLDIFHIGWMLEMLTIYWPTIFIVSGILRIRTLNTRKYSGALQDLLIGIVLQTVMLGWMPADVERYWPVALIAIGLWLVFVQPRNVSVERLIEEDSIHIGEHLRGSRIVVQSPGFEGGSLSALMSLVHCSLGGSKAGARIMRFALGLRLSGVLLFVPETWRVSTELKTTLSRVNDRRALGNPPENGNAPELLLEGSLFLAALEIRDTEEWVEEEEREDENDETFWGKR